MASESRLVSLPNGGSGRLTGYIDLSNSALLSFDARQAGEPRALPDRRTPFSCGYVEVGRVSFTTSILDSKLRRVLTPIDKGHHNAFRMHPLKEGWLDRQGVSSRKCRIPKISTGSRSERRNLANRTDEPRDYFS
uniref:Uncharacterized protein n=1 Tax=Vespula pensylvanica TaxID=30213 RepID=A0A834NQD4_VESPE|nr:hypothetical protein H0235_012216 [Vespula pensylvanica]